MMMATTIVGDWTERIDRLFNYYFFFLSLLARQAQRTQAQTARKKSTQSELLKS